MVTFGVVSFIWGLHPIWETLVVLLVLAFGALVG